MNYKQYNSIVDLIEKSIEENKNKLAIIEGEKHYTYCDLSIMIEKAEKKIINESLQGKKIALYLDKSVKFIALVIAIWKTGGTYIPIDVEMPKDRVQYIINDSETSCIVTSELKEYNFDKKQISIEKFFNSSSMTTVVDNFEKVNNDDIVYIIYTSGTTGKPKGVQITNNNLMYFMLTMSENFHITSEDRWLSITTVCFDISIFEMFFPIIKGSVLVIGKKRLLIDMKMLSDTISREKITIMQATPITWELLASSDKNILNNIKVLCGGDKLKPALAKELYENSMEVWNLYGPTETTIWSSLNKLQSSEDISIGKPMLGTTFYIFDNEMNLNMYEGELYIGGLGVSKGYIKNDELNRKKYIINPVNSNEIIYQTGDCVRYKDGRYYCIGRTDFQIKINGHRIEIEDIEKNLLSIDGVINAVVVPENNTNSIFAFVMTNSNHITEQYIKENLREKINSYMIPKKIFFVETFPTTFNKKIDKKYLIDKYVNIKDNDDYQYNTLENLIKSIWKNKIGEEIDINKSYKEYSIDSLTMTQISVEMEKIWSDFSISDIIKFKTIKNIIKNKEKTYMIDASEDTRLKALLNKYDLNESDIEIKKIDEIEKMMVNTYFLKSDLNCFQDCYIFKANKIAIELKNVRRTYEKEVKKKEELFSKYIFGRDFKVQSKFFEDMIVYEELYIDNEKILKEIINTSINEIVNINEIVIKLKVVCYKENIYFIFKYPHVRMDEISFFKLVNSIFEKNINNNHSKLVNTKLITDSNLLSLCIDLNNKQKIAEKADCFKTNVNNVIEFYILKGLEKQYPVNNVNYILNTKKQFGNNITICGIDKLELEDIQKYIYFKSKLGNKNDNNILISYNDISDSFIGQVPIDFEHVENNGFKINIEIYNRKKDIKIIVSLKNDINIDLKKYKEDILNLLKEMN